MNAHNLEFAKTYTRHLTTRRSVRHFSDEPVPREFVLDAIKTAASAPSGANKQPWHFALIESQEIKNLLRHKAEEVEHSFYHKRAPKKWLQDLEVFKTNETKAYLSEAPYLIAIFYRVGDEDNKTYYPIESTGIATGFLLTALHQYGLATLTHTPKPMNFLNQVLGLDKSYRPFMIVVTGKQDMRFTLPDIKRKQLEEVVSFH